jgi:hypothetical protein
MACAFVGRRNQSDKRGEELYEVPEGRFKEETSGEVFRQRFLEPAILAGEPIEVDLDGTLDYSSSFLDEAFGCSPSYRPVHEFCRQSGAMAWRRIAYSC